MTALDAHRLDIGTGGLGYPQPVQCQQRDQRMLGGRAEPGGDEQGTELVAVQGGGARPVTGFQVASEALDVGAAGVEEAKVAGVAPAGVLTQVQLLGLAGQAAVPGQEPG